MAYFNVLEQVNTKINEANDLMKMLKIHEDETRDNAQVLFLEPYYGSIHEKLIKTITSTMPRNLYTLIQMSPRNWHRRSRASAFWMSTQIARKHAYKVLFCSSLFPLAELIGLRPDLADVHKFVFFHENYLEGTRQFSGTSEYMCSYNEIMSCIVADHVLFNSKYNKTMFLTTVVPHLMQQADYASELTNLEKTIANKSKVVYFPLDITAIDRVTTIKEESKELHIVWPFKFESQEDTVMLFEVLQKLEDHGYQLKVILLAQILPGPPEIMQKLIEVYEQNKSMTLAFITENYQLYYVLKNSDVIVSAAFYEFFGVTVMEAIYCGCIPVVPRRHAFKELYGNQVAELYDDPQDLYSVLAVLCRHKAAGRLKRNYRHLVKHFDSRNWFRNIFQSYDCVSFDE